MKRLHFLVEGPTEKEFVDSVLAAHLYQYGKICDARLVTNSRDWSGGVFYKGGIASYDKLRHEIQLQISEDHKPDSYFTTMIDYYGLPRSFPGVVNGTVGIPPRQVVCTVETLFLSDVCSLFPGLNVSGHFVPNVICHEFESLLFSDLDKLEFGYPARLAEIRELKQQLSQFNGDPELVNTSPNSAPSKRIMKLIGEYDKVFAGNIVAMEIGLPVLRQRCAHFNDWIKRLEAI